MRSTRFHSSGFSLYKEVRLCFERVPENVRADMKSYEELSKNEDIMSARAIFDNPDTRVQYDVVNGNNTLHRAYFHALLMDQMLPDGKEYKDITNKDINPYDPFNLEAMATDADRGEWLKDHLSTDALQALDPLYDPATTTPVRLGQLYMDRVRAAKTNWDKREVMTDTFLTKVPLEVYTGIQLRLQEIFTENGIKMPDIGVDKTTMGDTSLSRREYLSLLTLLWKNKADFDEVSEAASHGLVGLRMFLRGDLETGEVGRFYNDVSQEEIGTAERLASYGIVVTPELIEKYINAVRGIYRGPEAVPGASRIVIPAGEILTTEETAANWEKNPKTAYPFLLKYMNNTPADKVFVDSLHRHFVATDAEKTAIDIATAEGHNTIIPEADTRALLTLISQSLMDSEKVIVDSKTQMKNLSENLKLGESIESKVGDVLKYMVNVREHPLGSAAMWLTAIVGARLLWKGLKSKTSLFPKLLAGGALAGLAVGLYQQHKGGEAFWESLWEKGKTWLGKEKTKNPDEQTLPNYWTEIMNIPGDQNRVVLGLLGDHNVGTTLDWYDRMRIHKRNGNTNVNYEPSPFRYSPKFKEYFGEMNTRERDEAFFTVLTSFFENRGRYIKQEIPEYAEGLGHSDDAALGYAYIKDRYVKKINYAAVIRGIEAVKIEIEGKEIIYWDPKTPETKAIIEKYPDKVSYFESLHKEYWRDFNENPSSNWDWNTIFLLEANPEALRKVGRDGTEAAGILDAFYKGVDTLKYPFTAEDLPDDAHEVPSSLLMGDAESALIEKEGRWMAFRRPEYSKIDHYHADWDSFVDRLPVDTEAADKLKKYFDDYIKEESAKGTINPAGELRNRIDLKKYQLHIAAMRSPVRLHADQLTGLNAMDETTWNTTLDRIIDLTGFDLATFPNIKNFADLQSLFDSEAYTQGGVSGWNIFRLLPHWKESDFKKLNEVVQSQKLALARLRINPILEINRTDPATGLLVKTSTILKPEEIDQMEEQISLRIANKVLEAMLYNHQVDDPKAPTEMQNLLSRADQREVTSTEIDNLIGYSDLLFERLLENAAKDIQPHTEIPTFLQSAFDYVMLDLPGDAQEFLVWGVDGIKAYTWDPVEKVWLKHAQPWIEARWKDAGILFDKSVDWGDKKLKEIMNSELFLTLKEFPNAFIEVSKEKGTYVIKALNDAGVAIGQWAYDTPTEYVWKNLYAAHGIEKEKYDAYLTKENLVENYLYKGKSAGLDVSVIGTEKIAIGQFDGIPFTNDGVSIELSLGEFLSLDRKEIVEKWSAKAFGEAKNEFDAAGTFGKNKLHLKLIGEEIHVSEDDAFLNEETAIASIYLFLDRNPENVYSAFEHWKLDTTIDKKTEKNFLENFREDIDEDDVIPGIEPMGSL